MMTYSLTDFGLIFLAYMLGSLSAAIIVCKILGLPDPRSQGSHNPGATNVLRFGGKKAAAITLAGDALKGVIAVLLAKLAGVPTVILALVALFAFLGHLYPLFFQFKGGKGVATAFGVLATISWPSGLCLLASWLIMAKIFQISSLSALIAACLAPVYIWYWEQSTPLTIVAIVMSVLLIWRHRSNIRKLISGSEGKI